MEVEPKLDHDQPPFTREMLSAVWCGDEAKKLQEALANGFNPNSKDNDGATILHHVAQFGRINCMKVLLAHPGTRLDVVDHMHRTALHYAAMCIDNDNAVKITKQLLAIGTFDIDEESSDHHIPTPLLVALSEKKIKLVKLLLSNGADMNLENGYGLSPFLWVLIYAENHTFNEIDELMSMLLYYNIDVDPDAINSAFIMAIELGDIAITKLLINFFSGANLFEYDRESNEPLIDAIFESDLDVEQIIRVFQLCECNTDSMLDVLCHSSRISDLTLFNNYYARLQDHYDVTCKCNVSKFFNGCSLSKNDFLIAAEKLLDIDFLLKFHPVNIDQILFNLIHYGKVGYKLQLHEIEKLYYQCFMYITSFECDLLYEIFEETGFDNVFEIFLKHDIKVSFSDHILSDYLHYGYEQKDLIYFRQLCLPSCGTDHDRKHLLSLKHLCRNVIRRRLRQVPMSYDLNKDWHYFRYYNEIQRLHIPQCVKDFITLKLLK